jgi:hypothetical protein
MQGTALSSEMAEIVGSEDDELQGDKVWDMFPANTKLLSLITYKRLG